MVMSNPNSRFLDMVDHPSHVKKLTGEQLTQLAAEIRQELITTTEALHHATNPEALQMTLRGIAAQGTVDAHERPGGGHGGGVDKAAAMHARHSGGRPG